VHCPDMIKDSLSYNPAYMLSDSVSFFRKFQKMQDEVPSGINNIKSDKQFEASRIMQVKIVKPRNYEKSLFSSHQLASPSDEIKNKGSLNPGWVPPVLLFSFMLFAIAQYGWPKRVAQIFKAFFVGRLFVQLAREGGLFNERVTLFLFSSYVISMSMFIFQVVIYYGGISEGSLGQLVLFLQILAGVMLFYMLKMLLFRFNGYVFKSGKETSDYVLTIYVFGQIAGILMLPFAVLVTYIQSGILIDCALVLFTMLYVYRIFRGAITVVSASKISGYYLFMYLCTLEILPLVIIAKWIIGLKA
jgi:hypothetical protein